MKILTDPHTKKQKVGIIVDTDDFLMTSVQDYAYVEFETEGDMQEALKSHTKVSVSLECFSKRLG